MTDVRNPFSFLLNWNPSYSYAQIPEDYHGPVPDHWQVMAEPVVPESRVIPVFRDIEISDVTVHSLFESEAEAAAGTRPVSRAFEVEAYLEQPIENVRFRDVEMTVHEAGFLAHIRDWRMENVLVLTKDPAPIRLDNALRVQVPVILPVF